MTGTSPALVRATYETSPEWRAARVVEAISRGLYRVSNERALQDAIERALRDAGIAFEREHELSRADRVDFLVGGCIALELKHGSGAVNSILRQVQRYAQHDRVKALIAASTHHSVLKLPTQINGKPLFRVQLMGCW